MGFFARLKAAFAPAKLTATARVAATKPLHEQFQRIGGGLTPADVSSILRIADAGQPERLIDLGNESRQKDGHMQSVCGTREQAVALVDLDFVAPKDATAQEEEAVDLCRGIRDDFKNWPTLVEHLAGSFFPGHATSEIAWEKKNGLLLPVEAFPIHPREFIFSQKEGALRYRRSPGDIVGVDLLADNPGRIVQVQRRIVGDVQAREGLIRVLVWAALFRNWTLRDWIALGEIGWKPWRIGKFKAGAHQEDVDRLVEALERIGTDGLAAVPETTELSVEWPKGTVSGNSSTHRELFELIGREMSKAVLGQTTSTEAGPNGDRGGVAARDQLRTDLRETDCRAIAAALRYHLFVPAVAINLGADVRCPVPWFQTEESADQKEFSEAVKNLVEAGLRIPAKWVRDEVGMPEPEEDEEVLEKAQVPAALGGGDEDDDDELDIPVSVEGEDDEEPEKKSLRTKAAKGELPEAGARNGLDYADRLTESASAAGARALAPTLAAVITQISKAEGYEDAVRKVEERYGELATPAELKLLVEADLILANIAGAAAVIEDTPELELEDET